MVNRKSGNYPLQEYYSRIYKRYDLVNRLFTLGNDTRWRRFTAQNCLDFNPQKVIDLCCGTGDLAILIGKYSKGKVAVTGLDFNRNMLEMAKQKAVKMKINTISFIESNAAVIPFNDGYFDCMTIGFGFRNLIFENINSPKYVSEISRVLKTGGHLLILESAVPSSHLIRFFYELYLKLILIPLGGIISGNFKAYKYLSRSAANFFHTNDIAQLMSTQRFTFLSVRYFFFGAASLIVFKKD
jgi:demethylmenaquinone methyltransferase/2-methoxy-6-polyprenyl-1,4-benzoquinol methylase